MSNFMSTQPFLFEYMKKDILVQIDRVKYSINILENTIYDHPDLLFNRLSLQDGSTTKIIVKIKEHERCLVKLNEELRCINENLARLAVEEQRVNVDNITKQMGNFQF